ncbi:hypothetical protein [Frigidibacter sp. MR17.24]|uniref:hypothetical protein n=1 Tax=Frigidibacter sp. MR17.24 TaxID=3127345 RepID=UPI0030131C2A
MTARDNTIRELIRDAAENTGWTDEGLLIDLATAGLMLADGKAETDENREAARDEVQRGWDKHFKIHFGG